LGIGDWGLGIGPNPQSPIPNPQSPIPNPHLFKLKLKTNKILIQIIIKIYINIYLNYNNYLIFNLGGKKNNNLNLPNVIKKTKLE